LVAMALHESLLAVVLSRVVAGKVFSAIDLEGGKVLSNRLRY